MKLILLNSIKIKVMMLDEEKKYYLEEEKTGNGNDGGDSGGSSDIEKSENGEIRNHIGDDIKESYRPTDELGSEPPTGDED